jgi:5'-nucleotidase
MSGPTILLTNDDGIDRPGFRAMYDALTAVGDVTAVAPAADQSAVGRAINVGSDIAVEDHDLGYALDGTPADCVIAGLEALVPDADLVVAGCNKGANLGAYVLGRSGTVSAAVEAAFFGVPAIAASTYLDVDDVAFHEYETTPAEYAHAVQTTAYLADNAVDAGVFETADYLNVNAPAGDDRTGVDRPPTAPPAIPMRVTRPSLVYDMDATPTDDGVRLHDRIWERMAAGDVPDPDGTDRRAVVDGHVSVSPLTAPHTTERHDALDDLADAGTPDHSAE